MTTCHHTRSRLDHRLIPHTNKNRLLRGHDEDVGVGLIGSTDVINCGLDYTDLWSWSTQWLYSGPQISSPTDVTHFSPIAHIPVSGFRKGLLSFQINFSAGGGIWFEPSVNVLGYPTCYYHTTSRYIPGNCNLFPVGLHGYLEGILFTLGLPW